MTENTFLLHPSHLKTRSYPFDIYKKNPEGQIEMHISSGRSLREQDLKEFFSSYEKKIAPLILESEKILCTLAIGIEEKELEQLAREVQKIEEKKQLYLRELLQEQKQQDKLLEGGTPSPPSNWQDLLRFAFVNDDFHELIDQTRKELLSWPLNQSFSISLAHHFADHFLQNDQLLARSLALTFLLSKPYGIQDQEALAQLLCACALKDIGQCQLPFSLVNIPQEDFSKKEKEIFQTHPLYSEHLCKLSKIPINTEIRALILTHHERSDGSGYPKNLMGDEIPFGASLLGWVEEILHLAMGRITGKPMPFSKAMKLMPPSFEKINSLVQWDF